MKNNPLRAFLLVVLLLGSAMLVYVPTTSSQTAAVAFSIEIADASIQLDVRPGASGVACTTMTISNQGTLNIDVDIQLSGGGVTVSPSATSVTLSASADATVPVCALALTQSSYKNVQVSIVAQGRESNTQTFTVTKYAGFTAQILQYARLAIRADSPFLRIGPGSDYVQTYTIINYGNYIDTVLIEVLNQEDLEEAGFTLALGQQQWQVDSLGEQVIPITMQTPRGTVLGWFNEYHTVIVKASTTLSGENEARTVTSTLWIRGVFIPGFDPMFSIMALALIASILGRVKIEEE